MDPCMQSSLITQKQCHGCYSERCEREGNKEIRSSIQEVLVTRQPNIQSDDFDFVNVKGKKIASPMFKQGQEFGYSQLKSTAGLEVIYVRLNKHKTEAKPATPAAPATCTKSAGGSVQQDPLLDQLKLMFPQHEEDYLDEMLLLKGNINDAIPSILSEKEKPSTKSGWCIFSCMPVYFLL